MRPKNGRNREAIRCSRELEMRLKAILRVVLKTEEITETIYARKKEKKGPQREPIEESSGK